LSSGTERPGFPGSTLPRQFLETRCTRWPETWAPDRFLAFFVYSDYSRVSVKSTKLHPMLFPVFAPIRYSRIRSMFRMEANDQEKAWPNGP
jgi:hypothetical protein